MPEILSVFGKKLIIITKVTLKAFERKLPQECVNELS